MDEEGARVILASTGRRSGSELRVDVRLLAYKGGRTRIVIDWFEGIRYRDSETVWEVATLANAIAVGVTFNNTAARLKRDGFRGLKPFPALHGYEIAEEIAYVKLTGRQPRLGDNFELQLSAPDAEALAALVDADSDAEHPAEDHRSARLRSLAQRRFSDLEGDALEKLREPRRLSTDS